MLLLPLAAVSIFEITNANARLGSALTLVADIAGDALDHPLGVLELVDGFLPLFIQHGTVGNHEQALPLGIVQRG